ncbi:MAG: succinate dehydrogenase assembly factor 2 [Gammaproteobacteria bacterium]
MDERRIRWLCRRGMKELDVMLARYMDACWAHADERERAAFVALLELQDPVLWDTLLARCAGIDTVTNDVTERIRALSGL